MGPAVVFLLGLVAGALLVRPGLGFVRWTLLAAGVSALTWVGGVYALLALTAPSELGPLLARPIAGAVLTALLGAALAGLLRRAHGARTSR